MNNKQHLVVVAGNSLYRYHGAKRVEHAKIEPEVWEEQTIAERKALIEDFRKNGLPAPVIQPADEAFHVAGHELQNKRALMGMELSELLALWDSEVDASSCVRGGHRIEDVWTELDRRGIKVPRG